MRMLMMDVRRMRVCVLQWFVVVQVAVHGLWHGVMRVIVMAVCMVMRMLVRNGDRKSVV